ncbi:MAG: hypothetical protein ACKOCW_06235 [Planctomycetaceae bacterium]
MAPPIESSGVPPSRVPSHPAVTRPFVPTAVGTASLALAAAAVAGGQWWLVGERPGAAHALGIALGATVPGAILGWLVARMPFATAAGGAALGLAGVALRLGLPLACLAWLSRRSRDGAEVDPSGLLLGAYLTLLAVDVGLHVTLRKSGGAVAAGPPAAAGSGVAD